MQNTELIELKAQIEKETGFKSYEDSANNQLTFYGTSDKLAAFKTLAADKLATGTVVYCMDDGSNAMYSAYKKQWF